jgi:hypothetical protein
MRRNIVAAIGGGVAILAAPCLWLAAASAIYCAGIARPDLFVFPFTQWLDVLPYWRANGWTTLWVGVSAAAPTLLIVATVIGLARLRSTRSPVYGKTEWATPRQMAAGKIEATRKPF